jgi:Tol biopolymer transport system component
MAELSKIDSRITQTVFTVFDPIQGRQRQLARLDFAVAPAFDFAISPNGEWIACVAMTNHIKLLHVADGATRDITTLPRWKFLQTITWSADGARLYVSVFSPEWNNLLLTADLSGNVRPLLENRHTWLGHPRASPDGRFLAWHEVTAEQNVGLLEDF